MTPTSDIIETPASATSPTPKPTSVRPRTQKGKRMTPATIGKRYYNAWKETCNNDSPNGSKSEFENLIQHIKKCEGYNKAGVSECKNEIIATKEFFSKQVNLN